MHTIIQPLVVKSQQLIVGCNKHMIYRMSDNEKLLFSRRLKELCTEKNLPEHGRQTILRKILNVSQEAVRKWLDGESVPKHDHKVKLCDYFNVHYEWLSTGRGQKYVDRQKSNAEKILEILGIDPEEDINNIDMEEVEIFRSTRLVPKENRQQLKKIVKTFSEPDSDGEKQSNS